MCRGLIPMWKGPHAMPMRHYARGCDEAKRLNSKAEPGNLGIDEAKSKSKKKRVSCISRVIVPRIGKQTDLEDGVGSRCDEAKALGRIRP